ncbi:MAG: type II toxin-antitoxin system PemK/MazF family toxin [Rhizobiaceae bacterium]|nr:type II toxin-antitoxin system PemK/MazF family toxin [Rhizobiaceae bacterium]MCV0405564.1 type II toxin-antitoxin system PemK/MazF family toxin [Rhizobiaceae bacterium]
MKRGEIWTVAGARDYDRKPRLSVIVQNEEIRATLSITVCDLTTDPAPATLIRLPVHPTAENGLHLPCSIMVDKITTIPRSKLGRRIGVLGVGDLAALDRAILVFLGLVSTSEDQIR